MSAGLGAGAVEHSPLLAGMLLPRLICGVKSVQIYMGVCEHILAVALFQAIPFLLLKSLTCKGWPNSRRCQHEENLLEKQLGTVSAEFPCWPKIAWSVLVQASYEQFHTISYFLVNEIHGTTAVLF